MGEENRVDVDDVGKAQAQRRRKKKSDFWFFAPGDRNDIVLSES